MVNIAPRHVLMPSPQLMVAFTGLEGDVQSLSQVLTNQVAAKLGRGLGFAQEIRQHRNVISPRSMASLTSLVLYSRRQSPYYVEPLVVGLTPCTDTDGDNEQTVADDTTINTPKLSGRRKPHYRPYLCSMDMIGAKSTSHAFVCAGAASDSMFGTAEALWKPNLSPEELVRVCAKAFLGALERDCLSGYGAVLYLITREGVTSFDLASRND